MRSCGSLVGVPADLRKPPLPPLTSRLVRFLPPAPLTPLLFQDLIPSPLLLAGLCSGCSLCLEDPSSALPTAPSLFLQCPFSYLTLQTAHPPPAPGPPHSVYTFSLLHVSPSKIPCTAPLIRCEFTLLCVLSISPARMEAPWGLFRCFVPSASQILQTVPAQGKSSFIFIE